MRRIRMPMPPSRENFRSSSNRSPDGSSTASLTSKFSVRRTPNWPGVLPPIRKPMMLPPASSPRSEIAISVPARAKPFGTITSASIPLLNGSLRAAGGSGTTSPERTRKTLGEIEPQHLVDALEADIDQRAVERDRFGIEPAARGDRLAVGAEHRRRLDVVEADHLAALVDDAAGEPASLVADGDEALALVVEPQARQAAEAAKPRGQDQPAAIFQRTEPDTRAVAGVERWYRPGVDLDRDRRGDREFIRNGRLGRPLHGGLRPRDAGRGRGRKPRRCKFEEAAAAKGRAHTLRNADGAAVDATKARRRGSR